MNLFPLGNDAVIDGDYRYTLTRVTGVDSPKKLAFLGQNPSSATADREDATSRKWTTYARAWGFGSYVAVNVFAYRSTDPKQLPKLERAGVNVCGFHNREWLTKVCAEVDMLVIACGTPPWKRGIELAWSTIDFLQTQRDLYAVRVTGGLPFHLLYQPGDLKPFLWRAKS